MKSAQHQVIIRELVTQAAHNKGEDFHFTVSLQKLLLGGSYFMCFDWAASRRAWGQPSKGIQTSNRITERPSGEMIVKSGLLAPVVLGRGCSLYLSPSADGCYALQYSIVPL